MNDRLVAWFPVAGLFLAAMSLGCGGSGQSSGRPDIDAIPETELRGAATKAQIYEFRAKVKKRGVAVAKQEVPELIEQFASYDKLKVSQDYKDTMKQIVEKLTALQGTLSGSPNKDAVVKAADEIGTLADKLPGKANANPVVE